MTPPIDVSELQPHPASPTVVSPLHVNSKSFPSAHVLKASNPYTPFGTASESCLAIRIADSVTSNRQNMKSALSPSTYCMVSQNGVSIFPKSEKSVMRQVDLFTAICR